MTCDGCKYAMWTRTKNGRLHPDKSGKCSYLKEHPLDLRIPCAFSWNIGFGKSDPAPSGGYIYRGKELRAPCEFKELDCDG
jgi:hypothetical protein